MELIKTPFTFEAVKPYRDFSTQDMNSNHAFFSVTAKAANTLEALCKQDNPWAPGPGQEAPGEGAPCPGWPENQAAAFRGSQLGSARPTLLGQGCCCHRATEPGPQQPPAACSGTFSSPRTNSEVDPR